jgi:hypothetical protein
MHVERRALWVAGPRDDVEGLIARGERLVDEKLITVDAEMAAGIGGEEIPERIAIRIDAAQVAYESAGLGACFNARVVEADGGRRGIGRRRQRNRAVGELNILNGLQHVGAIVQSGAMIHDRVGAVSLLADGVVRKRAGIGSDVDARFTPDLVIPNATAKKIVSASSQKPIIASATIDSVIALFTKNELPRAPAIKDIVAFSETDIGSSSRPGAVATVVKVVPAAEDDRAFAVTRVDNVIGSKQSCCNGMLAGRADQSGILEGEGSAVRLIVASPDPARASDLPAIDDDIRSSVQPERDSILARRNNPRIVENAGVARGKDRW